MYANSELKMGRTLVFVAGWPCSLTELERMQLEQSRYFVKTQLTTVECVILSLLSQADMDLWTKQASSIITDILWIRSLISAWKCWINVVITFQNNLMKYPRLFTCSRCRFEIPYRGMISNFKSLLWKTCSMLTYWESITMQPLIATNIIVLKCGFRTRDAKRPVEIHIYISTRRQIQYMLS